MNFFSRDMLPANTLVSEAAVRSATRLCPAPSFSDLERTVIELSRHDRLISVPGFYRWYHRLGWIWAIEPQNELASEKLEQLRQYAVVLRCRRGNQSRARADFLRAGYTEEQAELLDGIIRHHAVASQPAFSPAVVGIALIAAVASFLLMQHFVGDTLVSLMAAGLMIVTLASFAGGGTTVRY